MENNEKRDFYANHPTKKRFCVILDKSLYDELLKIFDEKGIPVTSQVIKYIKAGIVAGK